MVFRENDKRCIVIIKLYLSFIFNEWFGIVFFVIVGELFFKE